MPAKLLLRLRGGGGDQPDWTERGMISSGTKRPRGDRAPDWAQDPAKYAAKVERDKREAGELVVAWHAGVLDTNVRVWKDCELAPMYCERADLAQRAQYSVRSVAINAQ